VKLETIYLKQNKLNSIHSQTFNHLNKLDFLWLNENICIDRFYENSHTQLTSIAKDLQKCSLNYVEVIEKITEISDQQKLDALKRDVDEMRENIKSVEDNLKRMKLKLELMEESIEYFQKQQSNNISNYI
jgi:predicted  nucleic acid-binding Zn-ribbon protein